MSDHDPLTFARKLNCQELHMFSDEETGLKAIIAIHNTNLGPSLGGCRCFPYEDSYAAVVDVVRLAQGMTFKSSVSGLNLGGGKAVLLHDTENIPNRQDLFKAFGRCVESLNGRYITAVDVGTTADDMDAVRSQTRHVTSHHRVTYKEKDPSPLTAVGVVRAIQATAKKLNGSDSLEKLTINVQGLGHVGSEIVRLLSIQGAKVVGFDIKDELVSNCQKNYGMQVAKTLDDIMFTECDIFVPCAMGAILSSDSIPKLKTRAVVGAANNQLKHPDDIKLIQQRNILYAPDFVVNAGGIIYVAGEYFKEPEKDTVDKINNLYDIVLNIYQKAEDNNMDTYNQAYAIARERLESR